MKKESARIWALVAAVALLMLLLVQIRWIMHARHLKADIFNEKKAMVVARVTEEIYKDSVLNHRLNRTCSDSDRLIIDDLFKKYLQYYGVQGEYSFRLVYPPKPVSVGILSQSFPGVDSVACYSESLEEQSNLHDWMLELMVKDASSAGWVSLGVPVFFSCLLVFVVVFVFIRSMKLFNEEKAVLLQTRDLINTMAHELKTPITNISLAGKMSLISGGDEKYVQMMLGENNRMNQQVEAILNLHALDGESASQRFEEVDVAMVVEEVVKRFELQAEHRQGRIQWISSATNTIIKGDKSRISIALGNLLDNALKYTRDQPEVLVSIFNSGSDLIIEVSDNGIGVKEEYLQKIFERYFRVPEGDTHTVKGFGLGLAYVKQVVELHGGTVFVKSEIEKGTTFTLRLPHA